MPAMGTSVPWIFTVPYTLLESHTSGNMLMGMPSRRQMASSQHSVLMLYSMVRLALV